MDKKKSQHYNYTHEAVPVLFHSQYDGMLKYLERDRTKFLEFWWKHIGDQIPDKSLCRSPKGLNFEVRSYEGEKKILLVTLPEPERVGESYFLAGIKFPVKRIPMMKLPSSRVIVLDKAQDDEGRDCTWLSYVTPQARIVPIGYGPKADLDLFLQEVRKIMKI